LGGCTQKKTDDATLQKGEIPLVTVKGKTLYADELERALPEGLSTTDSTTAANSYIKRWISEVLLYEKAKSNVSNIDEINKLVENYRQSLTVYTYQEKLLNEVLSTPNKEEELKKYYDLNKDQFKLNKYILKGLFLKIPVNSAELNNMRKWSQSNTLAAKENIEKASIQNAVIYNYFYDKWTDLDEITSNMTSTISNPEQFLKTTKNYEFSDSTFVYLLHIEDFALPGTTTPFDYAKTQIKDFLINQERNQFIMQLETDLYNKALNNNEIKFYNK
jgi:hypothetical protein